VYDEIVSTLARQGRKTAIKQREVEDLLILKLGATQRSTLARHQELMVRLGWLKTVRGATAYSSAEYDLVGAKVKAVEFQEKARQREGQWKGGGRRR